MACDLLNKGWTRDEVNARLGHKPSSLELDKYINFLALDRHQPKKKIHQHQLGKIQEELQETKDRERLYSKRLEQQSTQLQQLMEETEKRRQADQIMTTLLEDTKIEKLLQKKLKEKNLIKKIRSTLWTI